MRKILILGTKIRLLPQCVVIKNDMKCISNSIFRKFNFDLKNYEGRKGLQIRASRQEILRIFAYF